jgi:hypothetical protein
LTLLLPRLALAAVCVGASLPGSLAGQASDTIPVGWGPHGIRVRFPIDVAPMAISRDTTVGDRFSGYEWRVVLERGTTSWLVAFVIPPDPDRLTLQRYLSNEAAIRAGGSRIRRCEPDLMTIRCGRTARGLVRLVAGQLELVVAEPRWYLAADSGGVAMHLAVRRGGEELWSSSHPLPKRPD